MQIVRETGEILQC